MMKRLVEQRRCVFGVLVFSIAALGPAAGGAQDGQAAPRSAAGALLEVQKSRDGASCISGSFKVTPEEQLAQDDDAELAAGGANNIPSDVPGTTQLTLHPGIWLVEFVADGCWSPIQRVTILSDPKGSQDSTADVESVLLRIWDLAWIKGELAGVEDEVEGPLRIEVAGSFRTEGVGKQVGGLGRQVCELGSDHAFRCPVPLRSVDARVWIDGFAPVYRWGLKPDEKSDLDVGSVPLRRGSSLSGWVVTTDGREPSEQGLWASLSPEGLGDAERESSRLLRDFVSVEGSISADGFLQVVGAEPGTHLLRVGGEGYAVATTPILLVEDKESVLREPIELAPPAKMAFAIIPPVPPDGDHWTFKLRRVNRYRTYFEDVLDVEVGSDGWVEAIVEPGKYMLNVANSSGEGVANVEVDTETAAYPVEIEIESVMVVGRLTLGDEPLAGRLVFGGARGAENARTASGEDGGFTVVLNRSGSWPVDVTADEPLVSRRVSSVEVPESRNGRPVRVTIELPDTRIIGQVVDENGAPQAGVLVYASYGPWENVSQKSDETGGFDFRGLSEGAIQLYAMTGSARSDPQVITTSDGREDEVTLVLKDVVEVRGRVIGPSGPVAGANVTLVPVQEPAAFYPEAPTDAEGRFTTQVSAGTRNVLVTVSALGHTLSALPLSLPNSGLDEIVVPLDREGGTLSVRRPREMTQRGAQAVAVYYRNGIPFGRGEVEKWASLHPGDGDRGLVIPALAPGRYHVCAVPVEEYLLWLRAVTPPILSYCGSVELAPYQEASVELPKL